VLDKEKVIKGPQKGFIRSVKGLIEGDEFDIDGVAVHVCQGEKELTNISVEACSGSDFGHEVLLVCSMWT
jgi:hypothetical protein